MEQFNNYLGLSIPGTGGTPIQLDSGLPQGVPTGGLFGTGQSVIVVFIELFLLGAVLYSLFTLIRGGVNMMTSGGDKQRFQAGRERIRYAIIGLLVVFFSFALVNILGALFGVNLLNLNAPTSTKQEQKPKPIDEQLMKICTDKWGQSYCTCLLNAKSTLTIDQQTQISNTIISTNQIPQQVIDLAKSTCGDAK